MSYTYVQQGSTITTTAPYNAPSISRNSNILAICVTSTSAALRVFRIGNNTLTELVINSLPATQIRCVAVSPTGNYIAAGADAAGQPFVRFWKYNSTTDEYDLIHSSAASATYSAQEISWAPDETYVAIAGWTTANAGSLTVCGVDTSTDTFYTAAGNYYFQLTGTTYRGMAVSVSPDSNFIAFSMSNGVSGATQRSYVYLLNRTTSTWSITATYTVPAGNSGVFQSWNADGSYLMLGRYASSSAAFQLVKATGTGTSTTFAIAGTLVTSGTGRIPRYLRDSIIAGSASTSVVFLLQSGDTIATTTTPAGLETVAALALPSISDISTTNFIAFNQGTSLYVYKAFSVAATGVFTNPVFGASATVDNEYGIHATLNYPVFQNSGVLNIPVAINGDAVFSTYAVQGSGGVFEVQYSTAYESLYSMIASAAPAEYSALDPVETYSYGNLTYSSLQIDGLVNQIAQANGDVIYPNYGILGFLNIIEMNGEITYPIFSVAGEMYNLKEFSGELTYPFFDVDSSVTLSTSGSGEFVFSAYTIDAVLSTSVIRGVLNYPLFVVDGEINVLYTEASGELNYPEYSASASVSLIDEINATLNYPAFEIAAEGDVPTWAAGDYSYAGYSVNGDIQAPIGAIAETIYPVFSTSGVFGVKVNINGDAQYSTFNLAGTIGFVLSIDGNFRYPGYQIAGYSGANPEAEGAINYPVYGVDFNIENYYGVASDNVLHIDNDDTIAQIGPRKNLIVTEH